VLTHGHLHQLEKAIRLADETGVPMQFFMLAQKDDFPDQPGLDASLQPHPAYSHFVMAKSVAVGSLCCRPGTLLPRPSTLSVRRGSFASVNVFNLGVTPEHDIMYPPLAVAQYHDLEDDDGNDVGGGWAGTCVR
jgi:hypothetical protein